MAVSAFGAGGLHVGQPARLPIPPPWILAARLQVVNLTGFLTLAHTQKILIEIININKQYFDKDVDHLSIILDFRCNFFTRFFLSRASQLLNMVSKHLKEEFKKCTRSF
jgi:hypothetical protein